MQIARKARRPVEPVLPCEHQHGARVRIVLEGRTVHVVARVDREVGHHDRARCDGIDAELAGRVVAGNDVCLVRVPEPDIAGVSVIVPAVAVLRLPAHEPDAVYAYRVGEMRIVKRPRGVERQVAHDGVLVEAEGQRAVRIVVFRAAAVLPREPAVERPARARGRHRRGRPRIAELDRLRFVHALRIREAECVFDGGMGAGRHLRVAGAGNRHAAVAIDGSGCAGRSCRTSAAAAAASLGGRI